MDNQASLFMQRCLTLARRQLGHTSPNPAVGAVVVKEGIIVGEGATQPPGGPHAEVVALSAAGEASRGATLYVSLEPCCHHGRTPPCTDAIIAAGIAEVHLALLDPYAAVNGRGKQLLEEAGIRTVLGEMAEEARVVNEGFLKWAVQRTPFTTAKYAMSLDGKIATRTGHSRWISGDESRTYVHQIRQASDAIMVGVGTVIADDPQLTTRLPSSADVALHHPLRVIVDSTGRIPLTAKVLDPALPAATLVATTEQIPADIRAALVATGATVLLLPALHGRVDLAALWRELGARQITSLLLEGGATLLAAALEAELLDKLQVFVAPKIIGGRIAPGPVGGEGISLMDQAQQLERISVQRIGADVLITGYCR